MTQRATGTPWRQALTVTIGSLLILPAAIVTGSRHHAGVIRGYAAWLALVWLSAVMEHLYMKRRRGR